MKFGRNLNVEIIEIENGVRLILGGVVEGIAITPVDFGKDLNRRKMEGTEIDPREEIDVLQGIKDEKTTGEDIVFEYLYGDKLSAIILAGTVAKKHLAYEVSALAYEIGGIHTAEKNQPYITIAVQKMLGTSDSIGGVVECILPIGLEMNEIKGEISKTIYDLMPEVTAIQFGNGVKDAKSNAKEYELVQNRVLVTFGPHMAERKIIPCLSAVRDVVVDSVLAIILA